MDRRKKRVFVSYAREDQDFVDLLLQELERVADCDFIRDEGAVRLGENVHARLAALIANSDVVMVVASDKAAKSEYVRSEVALALSAKGGTIPIIPVLLGSPRNIPYLIRDRLAINFSIESEFGKNVQRLARALVLAEPHDQKTPSMVDLEGYIEAQGRMLQAEIGIWDELRLARLSASRKTVVTVLATVVLIIGFGVLVGLPIALTVLIATVATGVFLAGYISGRTRQEPSLPSEHLADSKKE